MNNELPTLPPHNNRRLFSDHYLMKNLRSRDEWTRGKDYEIAFKKIKDLYKKNLKMLPGRNESQLEEEFIKPVMAILGFSKTHYIVQPSCKAPKGTLKPDYALFASPIEKANAERKRDAGGDLFENSMALCEAKRWKVDLSSSFGETEKDYLSGLNPGYQVDQYLHYSKVRWGILTNGRIWRLYEREKSVKLDRYYEINLEEMISPQLKLYQGSLQQEVAFKYFYLFFRRQAFPDFLEDVLNESVKYAEEVGEELKENVYKALRILAKGFVEFKDNELDPRKHKDSIRENSFVLLYRLLFVLYAESRHLLPLDEDKAYSEQFSLYSIKETVRSNLFAFDRESTKLWGDLETLFRFVCRGKQQYNIPPYNGGLFEDKIHPFLKDYKVGDYYLAQVIDLLCRVKSKINEGFIDYSSLEVQHLGSIYEGLLENRIEIAKVPMVALRKGKKETWEKESDVPEKDKNKIVDRVKEGEYYPVFKKKDRKATGSYYTPDYIVKYIIDHTLGPLIERCRTTEDILNLKVLDPAIGSGHFLVEATDYLARAIVSKTKAAEKEDEVGRVKRQIVERCIFGVDKNKLAVDLAKLSLWLHTVAKDKPLSFLDHHLRLGDSLKGLRIKQFDVLPKNNPKSSDVGNPFEEAVKAYLGKMIHSYHKIEDTPSDNIEQIKKKDQELHDARAEMRSFRQGADIWMSALYFGNKIDIQDYLSLIDTLNKNDKRALARLEKEKWYVEANKAWDKHTFFHWELEFPEAFFNEDGKSLRNPGFDAVIGNPPYVSYGLRGVGKLTEEEKAYYRAQFSGSAQYKISSYAMFMQLAIDLINEKGIASYIVPDSFLLGQYYSKVRGYVLDNCRINHLMLITDRVFEEGEVGTSTIFNIQKEKAHKKRSSNRVAAIHCSSIKQFPDGFAALFKYSQRYYENLLLNRFRLFFNEESLEFVERLEGMGVPASSIISIHTGARSKIGQKKIIASKPQGSTWKKGLISGSEIERYMLNYSGNYLNINPKLLWAGGWDTNIITSKKILIRQTADRLTATLDDNGYYHLNNLHSAIIENPAYDLRYVLALLNSKLLNHFYRLISLEKGRTMAQTDIETLEQLPFQTINFHIMGEKNKHDELVEMAQEILVLNSRRSDKASSFFKALCIEELICDSDDNVIAEPLRDKEIGEWWNWDFLKFSKYIRNKDPKKLRGKTEILEKRFSEVTKELVDISEQIDEIDQKIDCKVYTLYNLTDKEIKFIEDGENPCEDTE